jgi:hypothetical protein
MAALKTRGNTYLHQILAKPKPIAQERISLGSVNRTIHRENSTMPELSEISTPLLIELLACTHNARQVVARLDAVLGHVAECTMHGSVLNQLQDATKEMVSTIEAYEEVCKSAIELMRHPNFPLAEFDAGGTARSGETD